MSRSLAFMLLAATCALPASAQPADDPPLAFHERATGLRWGPCPPLFPRGCQIAVLHGDPARPNADVFLRIPGGYRIPAHRHSSAERMILVSGQLQVRYQGSPATILTAGTYAYGPAGRPHEARCVGRRHCTLFIAFEGPVDAELARLTP